MKVYYTKYALTKGIMVIQGQPGNGEYPGCFHIDRATRFALTGLAHPGEWFHLWGEAVEKADDMRMRAIHSANKKVMKLQDMEWEKPE